MFSLSCLRYLCVCVLCSFILTSSELNKLQAIKVGETAWRLTCRVTATPDGVPIKMSIFEGEANTTLVEVLYGKCPTVTDLTSGLSIYTPPCVPSHGLPYLDIVVLNYSKDVVKFVCDYTHTANGHLFASYLSVAAFNISDNSSQGILPEKESSTPRDVATGTQGIKESQAGAHNQDQSSNRFVSDRYLILISTFMVCVLAIVLATFVLTVKRTVFVSPPRQETEYATAWYTRDTEEEYNKQTFPENVDYASILKPEQSSPKGSQDTYIYSKINKPAKHGIENLMSEEHIPFQLEIRNSYSHGDIPVKHEIEHPSLEIRTETQLESENPYSEIKKPD